MKLLAVADLHFGLKQFDWVAEVARNYDAVIVAGDLLDISGHLDLDAQILIVAKYLRAISERAPLFVCSGNHDGDAKNEKEEYIARWLQQVRAAGLVVDGQSKAVKDLYFSTCPWWDGPATRAQMQDFLRDEKRRANLPWVWIHHAPPDGTTVSWTGKEHAGDAFLSTLIHELRPSFVFSGHIHNSPFRPGGSWSTQLGSARVFNPGKQFGAPPAYIVVDLASRQATWSSQAGEEVISLT